MLEIPIMIGKEQFYIISDPRNFILATKFNRINVKTKEREEAFKEKWFYGTLKGLFDGIFELRMKYSDAKSMIDLHEDMVKTKKYLMGLIDEHKDELGVKLRDVYDAD